MHTVTTTKLFQIGAGSIVKLMPEQIKTRIHNIEAAGPPESGLYRVIRPIEFRIGETLGIDTAGMTRAQLDAVKVKADDNVRVAPSVKPTAEKGRR